MDRDRSSGVFLHVTSLPGPHGVGDLGTGADQFLDFLERARQSLWQVCPLGPTTDANGNSPYQAQSAFAGSPLLIDLHALVDRGWLDADAVTSPSWTSPHETRYERARAFKHERLHRAHRTFRTEADENARAALAAFRERERDWLADYTLFAALKREYDGAAWTDWPAPVRDREPAALAERREALAEAVEYHAFVQWLFDEQWRRLKAAAADRGIDIVGDLPIYVAFDSADVWATPEAFRLDDERRPTVVAGVPPNPGDDGQRWGNPLYDWEHLADTDYDWWRRRLDRLFALVDLARIDHFRGFDRYWTIPADAEDPAAGRWESAPGAALFEAVREDLGGMPFIAEDLGFLDEGVAELRDRFDLPGMRVPHYADWCTGGDRHQPMSYPESVVGYTATHDTDTTVGYYRDLDDEQRDCLHYALSTDGTEIHWDIIEAVWNSAAVLAMTTLPDLLGLGSEARFNTPGTATGNWRWRVTEAGLDPDVADRLGRTTDATIR